VAGEGADESSCETVADVKVTEREGAVAVVEGVVLKMAKVDVVVVGCCVDGAAGCTGGAMTMIETR